MNQEVFSFSDLYSAYIDCRRRKRNTVNALEFELDLGENLLRLHKELNEKSYQPDRSVCFINTYPKPREIFAASFRDRIVHHLLVRKIEPYWEKVFIHDSYACRPDKGTHAAVDRMSQCIQQITHGRRKRAYYLQLDVKNFFMSIDKQILFKILEKGLMRQFNIPLNLISFDSNPDFDSYCELLKTVLFHNPAACYERRSPIEKWKLLNPEKSLFNCAANFGLPIGNLTSQFFANVYLNELDQFLKHRLKSKYYIRYVDDFILLNEDRSLLEKWHGEIAVFIREKLKLKLKDDFMLRPISCGINFLGYVQHETHRLVRRRVIGNCESKISKNEFKSQEKKQETINSYTAHFEKADSFKLRETVFLFQ